MKTETYELPEFWSSPLINDDWTGLDYEDEIALKSWLEASGQGYCIGCSDEPFFRRLHDASNYVLPCDCLTYTFQIVE